MKRLIAGMDGIMSAGLFCKFELPVVQVDGDDARARAGRSGNSPNPTVPQPMTATLSLLCTRPRETE